MYHCDFCNHDFKSREQFADHRSGHVRRGEISKLQEKSPTKDSQICSVCKAAFKNLGSHLRVHEKSFEKLATPSSRRNFLLRELGRQCQICFMTQWMGKPIPIQIDHIDGNSDNNIRENFRLLCPNCHAQTDTYCGKNMGKNGGSKRKEYLKNRKSYR